MQMQKEVSRQLVHLSGIFFILLAQVAGREVAILYFLSAAAFFLVYGEYIRRETRRLDALPTIRGKLRETTLKLERTGVRPFTGAFWFYFSCGISFLLFPFPIASAACMMLAVGDAFSTLVGVRFGRHAILKGKSLEGSIAFFLSSLAASLFFVSPFTALSGSIAATLAEVLPNMKYLIKLKGKGLLDDNFTVPIVSGVVMLLISIGL
ncbi:MAG: hypothetical protein HY367_02745 [Candidatus Aenigmarchaeota archaeon]|nr:hypothetical protein [Candidatus Aenigmarchaeota archaeon]